MDLNGTEYDEYVTFACEIFRHISTTPAKLTSEPHTRLSATNKSRPSTNQPTTHQGQHSTTCLHHCLLLAAAATPNHQHT
jgi:hypothetical protein